MRNFRESKGSQLAPGILQEESAKLKEKLDLLRQQISQKKSLKGRQKNLQTQEMNPKNQEKNLSKTTSIQFKNYNKTDKVMGSTCKNFQNQTNKTKFQSSPNAKNSGNSYLSKLLKQLKMETLQTKLQDKGIISQESLLKLKQDEIDTWKDILVGHRIKLKKFIKQRKNVSQIRNSQASLLSKTQNTNNISPQNAQGSQKKNIEQIIKKREENKIFVPLERKLQELAEQQMENFNSQGIQMPDEEQEGIIKSLKSVFHPRKGIIRQESIINRRSKKRGNSVHWSREVVQYQKKVQSKPHKEYPKERIPIQYWKQAHLGIQNQKEMANNSSESFKKYCWNCFKAISLSENVCLLRREDRYFCRESCLNSYQQECLFQLPRFKMTLTSTVNQKANNAFNNSREEKRLKQQQYKPSQRGNLKQGVRLREHQDKEKCLKYQQEYQEKDLMEEIQTIDLSLG